MLKQETLVAFLVTAKPGEARAFYEGVLGLSFLNEHEHGVVFDTGAGQLFLQKSPTPVTPKEGTSLGWHVGDLRGVMRALIARGVVFERYQGMEQDELGVWSPGGPTTGVAWFKDPDGKLLSLSSAG